MAKDWEFAQLTKWASEHGGPQKALEAVEDYYMKKGFKEGAASKNPIIVLVGTACLAVGVAVKCVYDKAIEKRALEVKTEVSEQGKLKEAEAELVIAMKQGTKTESEAICELEKNSPNPTKETT